MAGDMPLWQLILWGFGSVALLFLLWPGVKASMEQSQKAENKDWKGLFIPIILVVLFVLLLISLVRS